MMVKFRLTMRVLITNKFMLMEFPGIIIEVIYEN
jgi:hypothetical protein